MSIVDDLSPESRQDYLLIGRQFGSRDTQAQGNKARNALVKYGAVIAPFGYPTADADRLGAVLAEQTAAGVGRESEKTAKKVTNKAFVSASGAAKIGRRQARTVLESARRPLRESKTGQQAVADIDSVLERTQRSGANPLLLAQQLELLHGALSDPTIAAAAADRGGPQALAQLELALPTLRAADADRAGTRGTPAETELIDVLDGMIVTLVRDARRAARAAAEALGQPAIAKAFELDELYSSRRGGGGEDPGTDVTA